MFRFILFYVAIVSSYSVSSALKVKPGTEASNTTPGRASVNVMPPEESRGTIDLVMKERLKMNSAERPCRSKNVWSWTVGAGGSHPWR
jgi:hypothetical protein